MKTYYIKLGDQTKGPYNLHQLQEMWKKGAINGKATYCEEGGDKWRSLDMMQSVLEQEPSENPPDSGAHCGLRTAIYYGLGIAVLAAIIVLLRSLAK